MLHEEHPKNLKNVMVTFKKEFGRGPYGDIKYTTVVTKRGFWSDQFNNLAVPPSWQVFKGSLLPHGWGGDKLQMKDVIRWEYCNN